MDDIDQALEIHKGQLALHRELNDGAVAIDSLWSSQKVKEYVDDLSQGLVWQNSVIDEIDFTTAEPATPSDGDRYINTVSGTSSVSGIAVVMDGIYEWDVDDSAWEEFVPVEGTACWIEDLDSKKVFNGSQWIRMGATVVHDNMQGITANNHHTKTTVSKGSADGSISVDGGADILLNGAKHDSNPLNHERPVDLEDLDPAYKSKVDQNETRSMYNEVNLTDHTEDQNLHFGGTNPTAGGDVSMSGFDIITGGTAQKVLTDYGYLTVGPRNVSFCHFMTDRSKFYFNKRIEVNGSIGGYTVPLKIRYGLDLQSNAIANALSLGVQSIHNDGNYVEMDDGLNLKDHPITLRNDEYHKIYFDATTEEDRWQFYSSNGWRLRDHTGLSYLFCQPHFPPSVLSKRKYRD